jgi:hypothetical protein
MINVGEARFPIQRRSDEPESAGGDHGAMAGSGADDAQVTRAFDALLAQGMRAGAAGATEFQDYVETVGQAALAGGGHHGARAARGGVGAPDREADGGDRAVRRGDGGARLDVDDAAARELATATPRGPDPLGLTNAVSKEATSAVEGEAGAERPGGRRSARASETRSAERGADAGSGRGEGQNESGADAARGGAGGAGAQAAGGGRESAAAAAGASVGVSAARTSAGVPRAADPGAVGAVSAAANSGAGKGAARGESAATPMPRGAVGQAENGRAWSVKGAAGDKAATVAKPHEPVALQTSRAIAAAMKVDGDGVVTLKLAPDALGELRIQLHMKGERVSAAIEAQSVEARDLLKQTSDVLRMALEARGLSVERIEVTLKEPAADVSAGGGNGPRDERNGATDSNGGSGSAFDAGHADGDRRGSRESAAHGGSGRQVSIGMEAEVDGGGAARMEHDAGGWMTLGVDAVA